MMRMARRRVVRGRFPSKLDAWDYLRLLPSILFLCASPLSLLNAYEEFYTLQQGKKVFATVQDIASCGGSPCRSGKSRNRHILCGFGGRTYSVKIPCRDCGAVARNLSEIGLIYHAGFDKLVYPGVKDSRINFIVSFLAILISGIFIISKLPDIRFTLRLWFRRFLSFVILTTAWSTLSLAQSSELFFEPPLSFDYLSSDPEEQRVTYLDSLGALLRLDITSNVSSFSQALDVIDGSLEAISSYWTSVEVMQRELLDLSNGQFLHLVALCEYRERKFYMNICVTQYSTSMVTFILLSVPQLFPSREADFLKTIKTIRFSDRERKT